MPIPRDLDRRRWRRRAVTVTRLPRAICLGHAVTSARYLRFSLTTNASKSPLWWFRAGSVVVLSVIRRTLGQWHPMESHQRGSYSTRVRRRGGEGRGPCLGSGAVAIERRPSDGNRWVVTRNDVQAVTESFEEYPAVSIVALVMTSTAPRCAIRTQHCPGRLAGP